MKPPAYPDRQSGSPGVDTPAFGAASGAALPPYGRGGPGPTLPGPSRSSLRPNLSGLRPSESTANLERGDIRPADERNPAASGSLPKLSNPQKLRLTAALSRQLQVLVAAGTPLSQALHAVERTTRHPAWKAVMGRLRHDVEEGTPLSVSMRSSGVFDRVAISLVAAAETSGNMTVMLARLADLSRRQLKLRSAVTAALVYPCLLTGLGLAVLLTMLLFVLPRFEGLFASLDTPLPATTRLVLTASELLRAHWLMVLVGVGVVLTGCVFLLRQPSVWTWIDRTLLSLPKLGDLARSMASARIARMLGTLLESKVPLLESLSLTREGTLSAAYAHLLENAENAVSRGEPLSSVFDLSDLIVPPVQEAVRNGEASGQLGAPLCQLADYLDEENDLLVKTLTGLLEPAILIGLGLIVGFIAVSIFLPMFDLITAAQGGG